MLKGMSQRSIFSKHDPNSVNSSKVISTVKNGYVCYKNNFYEIKRRSSIQMEHNWILI